MKKYLWPVGVAWVGLLGFLALHHANRYEFTWGDNFVQFLPIVEFGADSLFSGHLPLWNPYQLLGSPIAALGYYGLFYLPTYISYAIATFVFADPHLSFEIFVGLHLMAALLSMYALLRQLKIACPIAAVLALSYGFSAANINHGSEWFYIWPTVAFFPLLLSVFYSFVESRASERLALFALLFAMYAQSGNMQFVFYSGIFLALFALSMSQKKLPQFLSAIKQVWWAIGASFFLVLPALYSVYRCGKESFFRSQKVPFDRFRGLELIPVDWIQSIGSLLPNLSPEKIDIHTRFANHYVGAYSPLIALGLSVSLFAAFQRPFRRSLLPWLPALIFGVLMAIGDRGPLFRIFYRIPFFNQFTNAFKYIYFANAFTAVVAAFGLNWLWQLRGAWNRGLGVVVLVASLMVSGLNANRITRVTTWAHAADTPPLNFSTFPNGAARFAVFAEKEEIFNPNVRGCASFLGYNCSTYARLLSFGGYETAISNFAAKVTQGVGYHNAWTELDPNRGKALYNWGVRYLVTPSSKDPVQVARLMGISSVEIASVGLTQNSRILELKKVQPLHSLDEGEVKASRHFSDGIELDLSLSRETYLRSRFLFSKYFSASMRGRSLAVESDEIGRLKVLLPPGEGTLKIKYRDWASIAAFYMGLLSWLAGAGLGLHWCFKQRNRFNRQKNPLYSGPR